MINSRFKSMLRPVTACLAIFTFFPLPGEASHTKGRYNGHTSVFLPYANANTNADLEASPTVYLGFNGGTEYTQFIMDTGSVGIVASADLFQPAPDAENLGPGEQFYSSSGIIEKGTWWSATQQFYDANGHLIATANVPVLQVTEIVCADNARSCTPNMHPRGISVMGIGFGREGPEQPRGTPSYNAFLNLTKVLQNGKLKKLPKDWCNGYVVTPTGIELGLTAKNTKNAGFVQLQPWPEYSTKKLPEWRPAPMTISVNGVSGNGNILLDTGVSDSFLTPPVGSSLGTLVACPVTSIVECAPDGAEIAVYLPNQTNPVAYYTFTVGQTGNPMQPLDVIDVNSSSGVFFNTSRHILGGINFIYDNKHGYAGYIWNGNSSSSVGYVKPSK